MNLYNQMKSQSAGEQYSSQSVEYNGSQRAFYNIFYNISGPCFSSLLSQNKGILLVFGNFLLATGFAFIGRVAAAEIRFLLLVLVSVTGRCLYLGSLNEGCKGWECS